MLTPTKKRVLPTVPRNGSSRTPRSKDLTNRDKENNFCGTYTPSKKKVERNIVTTVDLPLKTIKPQYMKDSLASKRNGIDNPEEDSFFGLAQERRIPVLEEKKSINHRASLLLESEHALQPNFDDSSIKVAVRVRPFSDR